MQYSTLTFAVPVSSTATALNVAPPINTKSLQFSSHDVKYASSIINLLALVPAGIASVAEEIVDRVVRKLGRK